MTHRSRTLWKALCDKIVLPVYKILLAPNRLSFLLGVGVGQSLGGGAAHEGEVSGFPVAYPTHCMAQCLCAMLNLPFSLDAI